MRAAARELLARFPDSPYLESILEAGRDIGRPPSPRVWKASFESRLVRSRLASLDQDLTNRLKGEIGQAGGGHAFREFAALSLKGNLGRRDLEGFQAGLGAEWRSGGFSLGADWVSAMTPVTPKIPYRPFSPDRDPARDTPAGTAAWPAWTPAGREAFPAARTCRCGRGCGCSRGTGGRREPPSRPRGAPAWGSGAWTLTALLDAQYHAMRWSVRSVDTLEGIGPFALTYATEGMQTLLASVAPAWATGGHEIGIDLGYLLTRYAGKLILDFSGLAESERDYSWEHALALSPAWRWRLSRDLRFRLSASFGYDFEERGAAVPTCREWLPGYCAEESYGADAGFSLSF